MTQTNIVGERRIHLYQNINHVELASLPKNKTAVLIPISPLEEHGPHLPFGVDAFLAEYFSSQMAQRLSESRPDWHFLILPTFFAGSDTLQYLGSIEVRQYVIKDLLYDCASKLARDGFQFIIAVGGHGGPRHMVAMEEVASKISWRFRGTKMISASNRFMFEALQGKLVPKLEQYFKNSGAPLTEDEVAALKTDYHAGFVETSLMMVIKPDLVKPGYKDLKPAIVPSVFRIRKNSAQKVGGGFGHLGTPSLARPDFGNGAIEVILGEMIPLIGRFLDGDEKVIKEFRSQLYYVPFFRTHFKYILILTLSFLVVFASLAYFTQLMAQLMSNMR